MAPCPATECDVGHSTMPTRLLLLQRRLGGRAAGIRMDKCDRGRFRLVVDGSVVLEDM